MEDKMSIWLNENNEEFLQNSEHFCAVMLCPKEILSVNQIQEMEKILERYYPSIFLLQKQDGQIIMLCKAENRAELKSLYTTIASFVNGYMEGKYRVHIDFIIGTEVESVSQLKDSYEKLYKLQEYLYIERVDRLYEWEEYISMHQDVNIMNFVMESKEKVQFAVYDNKIEDMHTIVKKIAEDASTYWYDRVRTINFFQGIIFLQVEAFRNINIENDYMNRVAQVAVEGLYKSTSIGDMMQIIYSFLDVIMEVREANLKNCGERLTKFAVEYISRHFDDNELSMMTLCEKMSISKSYFCSIFKEYTGKTFVEVLTQKRMEEAKLLLQNLNLKSYEVAERCGYRDSGYFGAMFKKTYGMTPKEYQKNILGQ